MMRAFAWGMFIASLLALVAGIVFAVVTG